MTCKCIAGVGTSSNLSAFIPKTLLTPIYVVSVQQPSFGGFQLIAYGNIHPSLSQRYSQNFSATFALQRCVHFVSHCLITQNPQQ